MHQKEQSMETLIWVHHKDVKEVNNQTGFVVCDIVVAKKLIKRGDAQYASDGANHLKYITDKPKATRKPAAKAK